MPGALEKFQFWNRDVKVLTITPTEMNYLLVTFKTSLFISILYGLDVYFRNLWQPSDPKVVMFLTTKSDKEAVESNENWWGKRVINSKKDPLRAKWLVKPEEKELRGKLERRLIISQVQSASSHLVFLICSELKYEGTLLEFRSDVILDLWEEKKDHDPCVYRTYYNKIRKFQGKFTEYFFKAGLGKNKIK